ncbi:PAS domain-containing hybrid sensor histidine kinase/response regulator [Marinimicrococcus flavescens]|uniref:histidine kinase n=1 Tax=Marinimicrococcus flavescens TaxID=3031815 RepID=A0AAP3XRE1_9PROT|nr:ATP-binding protein [Marinimicrococcus flavescens]
MSAPVPSCPRALQAEAAADNAPGVLYQFRRGADGVYSFPYVSRGIVELYGLTVAQVVDDPAALFAVVVPDDRAALDASIEASAANGSVWEHEFRAVTPRGERWVRGRAVPTPLADGAILWNGMLMDITVERQYEQETLRARRLRSVGQLAGGIAHDFNNLLTVILGSADELRQSAAGAEIAAHAGAILAAAERAAELTARLLAFASRRILQPARIDVNEQLAALMPLLERTIRASIRLDFVPSPTPAFVELDPGQLDNAILNLVLNARDAIDGQGRITLAVLGTAQEVTLTVSDTGHGIAPEHLEKLFEPFFTTRPTGTGFGLPIVYGFVQQSRGRIEVLSPAGAGTTVTLRFPASAEPARTESGPTQRATAAAHTVLVVEDDPLVRRRASMAVGMLGHRVLEAADGASALELLRGHPEIDLLFTDLVMPGGIDGVQLARQARTLRPGIAVLFTTGYAGDTLLGIEQPLQSAPLLSKPWRQSQLADKLAEALGPPAAG